MNCNVIQDLLPLCVDACCSQESRELVMGHLDSCPDCRRAYEAMGKLYRSQQVEEKHVKFRRISGWKASVLQSVMLFVSFVILAMGVVLEGNTPEGSTNGLWAVGLIVPATGYLLSLANWFFVRSYRNRKAFSTGSCIATLVITALGYLWAVLHYAGKIVLASPQIWLGVGLSILFCILSKVLSNQYALLLGRE